MRKWKLVTWAVLLAATLMLLPSALAESGAPTIDLTELCGTLIAALCALVTYRLIPWIKARASAAQQEALGMAVRTAVYAAEQLYRTNVVTDRLDYAERWLKRHGYSVDRAQIEAQVKQMRIDSALEGATLIGELEATNETETDQEGESDE